VFGFWAEIRGWFGRFGVLLKYKMAREIKEKIPLMIKGNFGCETNRAPAKNGPIIIDKDIIKADFAKATNCFSRIFNS